MVEASLIPKLLNLKSQMDKIQAQYKFNNNDENNNEDSNNNNDNNIKNSINK